MVATVIFKEIKSEILRQLKKAEQSIKVVVAWLTDEDIIRVLSQQQENGITVQIVICDSKENFKKNHQFKNLLRYGGGLGVSQEPFMHHKFCLIDDKVILNGSYNWSYPAQRNNENLMVLRPDAAIREDKLVLLQFQAEFGKLYKNASPIVNLNNLDAYKQQAKNLPLLQSDLELWEITLRQQFEDAVQRSMEISKEIGIQLYYTYILERIKSDGGGVFFAKRLICEEMQTGEMKPGFKKLEEHFPPRVDLSIEYLVSRPEYEQLFTENEKAFCLQLMRKYGL